MILKNYAFIKDSFKVQGRYADFNTTKYTKFIYIISYSTLQLTFKKLSLEGVWCNIKDKKAGLTEK